MRSNLKLGLMLTATGAHFGSWRLPGSTPEAAFRLAHYSNLAAIAERGLFDFVFVADTLAHYPNSNPRTHGRAPLISHLEPFTMLAAQAVVTQHLELAGSATTTYNHPYQVARMVASRDHIGAGRAQAGSSEPGRALAARMSIYPLDEKLPADIPDSSTASSRRQLLMEQANRDNL